MVFDNQWQRHRACGLMLACWLFGAPAAAQPAPEVPESTTEPTSAADHTTLAALLQADGYVPPPELKALVLTFSPRGTTPLRTRAYDYGHTALDRDNWWPASTIKLYAAIAFLARLQELRFSTTASLTFEYREGPATMTAAEVVEAAIAQSNNLAYDRLVEFVGFDALNRDFLQPARGFGNTRLLRSYAHRVRYPVTGRGSNRHSPPIRIREGTRSQRLPERNGTVAPQCPDNGNCTTLWDLAETMRRLMLHDELPPGERFNLNRANRRLLQSAMSRARSYRVAEMLGRGFGHTPVELFHKPGFAAGWVSDVLFVRRPGTGERWVVALAARGPRPALDDTARRIGRLLRNGQLPAPAR